MTVATFSGPLTYVLHDGSEDPGLAAGRVKAGPAVRGAERGRLLAAFNGGFNLPGRGRLRAGGPRGRRAAAGPGQPGDRPLRPGQDRDLGARRARAGRGGVQRPAEPAAAGAARQADRGAADWSRWGATLGGGEDVARSALGQDAAGHLVYAASMSASPADLAAVMAYEGVRIAMELDINPEWVQLDVARRPGGPLRAAIRGQSRPANQFLLGWARDFIAVLAPAGAGG